MNTPTSPAEISAPSVSPSPAEQTVPTAERPAESPADRAAGRPEATQPDGKLARRIGRRVIWLAVMAEVALFAAGFVMQRLPDSDSEALISLMMQVLILLLPALLAARYLDLRASRRSAEEDALPSFGAAIRLRRPRADQLPLLLYAALALIAGTLMLDMFFGSLPDLMGRYALYDTFSAGPAVAGEPAPGVLALLLIYALVPAVCEEMLYRGIFCTAYEPFGLDCALILSALLSGFLSGSLRRLPSGLFLGLLLAAVTYATRTIAAPMLVHFLYHAFCLFARPWLASFYVRTGNVGIFVFLVVCIFLGAAALFCFESARIYRARLKEAEEENGESYAAETSSPAPRKESPLQASLTLPRALRTLPRRLLGALMTPAAPLCLLLWLLTVIF